MSTVRWRFLFHDSGILELGEYTVYWVTSRYIGTWYTPWRLGLWNVWHCACEQRPFYFRVLRLDTATLRTTYCTWFKEGLNADSKSRTWDTANHITSLAIDSLQPLWSLQPQIRCSAHLLIEKSEMSNRPSYRVITSLRNDSRNEHDSTYGDFMPRTWAQHTSCLVIFSSLGSPAFLSSTYNDAKYYDDMAGYWDSASLCVSITVSVPQSVFCASIYRSTRPIEHRKAAIPLSQNWVCMQYTGVPLDAVAFSAHLNDFETGGIEYVHKGSFIFFNVIQCSYCAWLHAELNSPKSILPCRGCQWPRMELCHSCGALGL